MRQYVSICGHSAVGKKTLIHKILSTNGSKLRNRFDLSANIQAYERQSSLDKLPLLREIFNAEEECVLHFWQDKSHPWIECLRRTFTEDRHRVVLLWRPWDIHSAAQIDRQNEYKPSPMDLESHWHDHIVPLFRGIEATGIEFELVDASTATYERRDWPS